MASGAPTVFIIDDDASVRRALGRVMTTGGLDWKSFGSVEEFLDGGESVAEGCIVTDLVRPGMDCVELRKRLESARAQLPLIILTANETEEAQAVARDTGAVAYFRKPVDSNALLDAVRWAIRAQGRKPDYGGS